MAEIVHGASQPSTASTTPATTTSETQRKPGNLKKSNVRSSADGLESNGRARECPFEYNEYR